jgi:hypothetical protein
MPHSFPMRRISALVVGQPILRYLQKYRTRAPEWWGKTESEENVSNEGVIPIEYL